MIKRTTLLALAFVCLPMFANASIISIEYTGHVDTLFGAGNGYSYGDVVSGKIDVDLSKATYVDLDGANTAKYQAPVSNGLVVGAVNTDAEGWDVVEIYNGTHISFMGEYDDFFQIIESRQSSTLPGWVESFQLTIELNGFDWLTDTALTNANIITDGYTTPGFSFGVFNQSLYSVDADGNSSFQLNAAAFSLDSLKLVSTEVAEPNSIALILIGGLALLLRRRRS
ncbi:MAG: PEP-CTERM sorting domain-containing protein [Gammaproteobacteria bacterium]|nr:MAG: PEP-CTERM sorting domain-containing protein [Gammaproteobacteria bacterium]